MRIVVSGGGRFHLFELALQLQKREHLARLITSYPARRATAVGIEPGKVTSIVSKEIVFRGGKLLPRFLRFGQDPQYLSCELFDRRARGLLPECDIFAGLSSFSLKTLRRARRRGAVTVLERGSTHILFQQQILREEYERFGLSFRGAHPRIVDKELQEYEESDRIFVPSHFARQTFRDRGIAAEKVAVLPYGVDLDIFQPGSGREDGIFRVIFCGKLNLQKGVHYLLRAFSELNLPGSELLLIGRCSPEFSPFLDEYEGAFNWIGPQPRDRLPAYFRRGTVFVLDSIQEGMALVQLEAMASGLPLICSTNTGGEDLIENGEEGFVIPIRNLDALKEKILFFYENRSRARRMGMKARRKVGRGFSWSDYGERIVDYYKTMLR